MSGEKSVSERTLDLDHDDKNANKITNQPDLKLATGDLRSDASTIGSNVIADSKRKSLENVT